MKAHREKVEIAAMEMLLDAKWNGAYFMKVNPEWEFLNGQPRHFWFDRQGNHVPATALKAEDAQPPVPQHVRFPPRRGKSQLAMDLQQLGRRG